MEAALPLPQLEPSFHRDSLPTFAFNKRGEKTKRMLFWYVHIFLCIKTMTHRSNIDAYSVRSKPLPHLCHLVHLDLGGQYPPHRSHVGSFWLSKHFWWAIYIRETDECNFVFYCDSSLFPGSVMMARLMAVQQKKNRFANPQRQRW